MSSFPSPLRARYVAEKLPRDNVSSTKAKHAVIGNSVLIDQRARLRQHEVRKEIKFISLHPVNSPSPNKTLLVAVEIGSRFNKRSNYSDEATRPSKQLKVEMAA